MFDRIKILTLLQLGNKMKISNIANKKKFALNILLMALLAIVITVVIFMVLKVIKGVLFLPVNKNLLTFILFVTQVIAIISSTMFLMQSLYKSKDNAILLSYPAKHHEVFFSKLIIRYLHELKSSVFFTLPLLIAFGVITSGGALYFIASLFLFFILPLFPVGIGAILSIPLIYLKRWIDKVPVLYIILFIGIIVLAFVGLQNFVSGIPQPLRLVTVYTQVVNDILNFIMSINAYSLYYTFITDLMYGINVLLNGLFIILIIGAMVGLVYVLSMPTYFKLACKSFEFSTEKQKRTNDKPVKNIFFAFFKKELKFMFRSGGQFVSNYFLILIMPIILYFMNVVFSAIITSDIGNTLVIAFNLIVTLILVLSSNTQSATAITVEGEEIAILKTAPSNTSAMVWAKMVSNIIVSSVLILISSIILSTCGILETEFVWRIFAIVLLVNCGHILWSFQLDVVKPNLRDYAQTGKLENCPNVTFSLSLALIISFLMGVLSIFFLMDSFSRGWLALIAIAIVFFVLRLYFFINNMKVYFKRIEY